MPQPVTKANVKAVEVDDGIKLTWNAVDPDGFVYYKVVVSKYNDTTAYPNDGYIAVISDYRTNTYVIKNGASYSGGDFGGKIRAGETYYFSITAVYDFGKVRGNAVRKAMPESSEPAGVTKATVSVSDIDNGVKLTWNPVDPNGFVYYKVVVSKYNDSPIYPDDGYMAVISDPNNCSYLIGNGASYNGGDFGGKIRAGETYYFSITAVYDHMKVRGNAVRITMPQTAAQPSGPTKATVSAQTVDSGIKLTWNPVDPNGFVYYKVVVSKNNSSPAYPDDGYYTYISDYTSTSCTVRAGEGYSGGDFGGTVKAGETYYFSITAVYDNGKFSGNAVRKTMPGQPEEEPADGSMYLGSAVVNGKLVLNWSTLSGSGFNYYKVVISKYDANPQYPEDGYLYYYSDINRNSAVIDPQDGYNGGDFGGKLVSGEKYYVSITAVFNNKKILSNVLYLTLP